MADFRSRLPTEIEDELTDYAKAGFAFTVVLIDGTVRANSAETAVLYLKNTSSKTMYIAAHLLTPGPTQGNWVNFNVYYNPTVTANGTSVSIVNLLAGSANASVMSAFTAPTVTSNGVLIDAIPNSVSNSTAGPFSKRILTPYYIIPPNNSILFTGVAKANNTPVYAVVDWFEA